MLKRVLPFAPKYGLFHLWLATIAMREGRTSGAFGRMVNASEFEAGVDETGYYYLTAWLHCVGGDYETAL